MSLFWRIFLLNAAVLVVATALLLFGPVTVSTPVLVGRGAGPGRRAGRDARRPTPSLLRIGLAPLAARPGRWPPSTCCARATARWSPATGEIAELIRTFNTMLDRLEAERATSAAGALSAQEASGSASRRNSTTRSGRP